MMPELKLKAAGASAALWMLIGAGLMLASGEASAQEKPIRTAAGITDQDLPGDHHKYYGQRTNRYGRREQRIAKLDLDGDFNYDGTIDNDDPADNGAFQQTPPGLVLGSGELSKLVLRLNPYRLDIDGEIVVTLEAAGINRGDKSGEFENFAQEMAATGRIRVWKDASRKVLLIDSGDPERRFVEWVFNRDMYPANVPRVVPRTVYVEGMKPSPKFSGDLRLLATVTHRKDGGDRAGFAKWREIGGRKFRTAFDHILLTVRTRSHEKEFVNANAEKVWLKGLPAVEPKPQSTGTK